MVLDLGKSVGLEPEVLRPIIENRTLPDKVAAQTDGVRMMQIWAVRWFVFSDKWLIQGAQPYETFKRVVDDYVVKPAKNEGEG